MNFLCIYSIITIVITTISANKDQVDFGYDTLAGQQRLVRNEQKLIGGLLEYKNELEQLIFAIKNYTTSFHSTVVQPLQAISVHPLTQDAFILDGDKISGEVSKNPLMILQLLQRLVLILPVIENRTKTHKISEFKLRQLLSRSSGQIFKVGLSDLEAQMQSLLYLNLVYHTRLDDLAIGRLSQVETKSGLSAEDFYILGTWAHKMQFHSNAINFLEKGQQMLLDKMEGTQFDRRLDTLIKLALEKAIIQHDKVFDELNGKVPFLFKEKVAMSKDNKMSTNNPREINESSLPEQVLKFSSLCRGMTAEPDKSLKNGIRPGDRPLKSFLFSKIHPYWILSPLKVQVHSIDPLVLQYYDILTDHQLGTIKAQVEHQLVRSKIVAYGSKELRSDDSRISASSYIYNDQKLARKIELITGLKAVNVGDAEVLQVTNYATGGYFVPHFDSLGSHGISADPSFNQDLEERGDRLVTFMFYINEVEQGGRTGFPELGVSVEPIKGSALMWHNLNFNGTTDQRTIHGGCNVVIGTKWMATKWIRSNSQMFIRKCGPPGSSPFWVYDSYGFDH